MNPTYKKVKGSQPLQVYWGRHVIDAIFRNEKAHGNYGNHVARVVGMLVKLIRQKYKADIPIVFVADTGFFDQKLLKLCQDLCVGLIVGGKMYASIKKYVASLSAEDDQILFEFARPETVIYTNIGLDNVITRSLQSHAAEIGDHVSAASIIRDYHQRGCDELVNRGLKDFGSELLPFERFASNAAFYYLMVIAYFLFEVFKQEVGEGVVPITWYATTFRRHYLDVAGKVVRTTRRVILKVTSFAMGSLKLERLWTLSVSITPLRVT